MLRRGEGKMKAEVGRRGPRVTEREEERGKTKDKK